MWGKVLYAPVKVCTWHLQCTCQTWHAFGKNVVFTCQVLFPTLCRRAEAEARTRPVSQSLLHVPDPMFPLEWGFFLRGGGAQWDHLQPVSEKETDLAARVGEIFGISHRRNRDDRCAPLLTVVLGIGLETSAILPSVMFLTWCCKHSFVCGRSFANVTDVSPPFSCFPLHPCVSF